MAPLTRKKAASHTLLHSSSKWRDRASPSCNSAGDNTISGSTSMKFPTAALSLATLSLAMLTPSFGQSMQDNEPAGLQQAQHMVPARASLTHALDSDSTHSGDQFRATLSANVHLNGGAELHRGDVLLGQVVDDDTNTAGKSRLAVRFTQAVLKNGQNIPIKATIVGLYSPDALVSDSSSTPDQIPDGWTDGIVQIDQLGVVKNVDLHSRISSENSGVFVSTQKNNVKIPAGSEIALAIAAQSTGTTNSGL